MTRPSSTTVRLADDGASDDRLTVTQEPGRLVITGEVTGGAGGGRLAGGDGVDGPGSDAADVVQGGPGVGSARTPWRVAPAWTSSTAVRRPITGVLTARPRSVRFGAAAAGDLELGRVTRRAAGGTARLTVRVARKLRRGLRKRQVLRLVLTVTDTRGNRATRAVRGRLTCSRFRASPEDTGGGARHRRRHARPPSAARPVRRCPAARRARGGRARHPARHG